MAKILFTTVEFNGNEAILTANGGQIMQIDATADRDQEWRFTWLQEHANEFNFAYDTDSGRWSKRRKDRHVPSSAPKFNISKNEISLDTTASAPFELGAIKLSEIDIDESLFESLKTGTQAFDEFWSSDLGFQRGSSVMVTGEPGAGKTTMLVEMAWRVACQVAEQGYKVGFVSAEMGRIDMARYLKRFPHWKQYIDVLFLGEHAFEDNATRAFEEFLNEGYDLIVTDSFTEVCDTTKEEQRLSSNGAEKWFLMQLQKHAELAQNKRNVYTSFVTILQLTKGGQFVGSNKLKHMTTAMCHMKFDKQDPTRRYMEFSKNRTGLVGAKLFYKLTENSVEFDTLEWENTKVAMGISQVEADQLKEEEDLWEEMLNSQVDTNTDEFDEDDDMF